jgi:membrane protein
MQVSNAIYDVPEGRPVWKTIPIRIGLAATYTVIAPDRTPAFGAP